MKRVIKASTYGDVIFEDENFVFQSDSGVGMNSTPWEGLVVESKGLAYKHVVDIRLTSTYADFNGEPVVYKYRDVYVAHGMRTTSDSLDETLECAKVLEDAVDFAHRVIDWIRSNPEYDGGI